MNHIYICIENHTGTYSDYSGYIYIWLYHVISELGLLPHSYNILKLNCSPSQSPGDQSFRYPGDGCDAGPTSGAARTAAQEVAGGPGVWGVSMEEPIRPREHPFDDWTKSRPSGRVSRLRRIDLALRGLDFQATQRQDEDGEAI